MDAESKTPSLVYEVCFGAVFKVKLDGRRVLALTLRQNDGFWLPASEIDDAQGIYKDMGVDKCEIVHVLHRDTAFSLKSLFGVTLSYDGDTGSVARAMKAKVLGKLLEEIFSGWLKESGPILVHATGEKSFIWPTDLVAKYDAKDFDALRKAYAYEMMDGVDEAQKPSVEKSITRFNQFMDLIQEGDELFWFSHNEPLADRIGYCILRAGRAVAAHLVMMS